jgi:hypothetical protein
MRVELLNGREKQIRFNVRNFLCFATREELEKELSISEEMGDHFRAACIRELISEL